MHYYPHHIGDYRAATAHLSNEEDLAYRRLLEMYYDTEQPIPLETQWVARRLRVGSESVQVVLNDFFQQREDGWHHTRCEEEIKEYAARADRARKNGKNGGRRKAAPDKAENPVGSQSVPSGNPELTQPLANQEPVTSNQEPITPISPKGSRRKSVGTVEGFAEFWDTWPTSLRKVGKVKCEEKWKARNLSAVADKIIAHVKAMKQSEQWTNGYEPSPMTYINQSRWEDGVAGAKAVDDQFAGVM
jgi:uncharacterized protein YdaU (DUF1376 family)